ncbi:DUF2493 domain-containing protein [Planomonospora sp. ID82291]|uniref:DUF2493 domain-containing protein n=1 Tax=Planomonospora sp. ID82291 TaxID=2738136 RepID=UPI0018C3CC8A|nr:DUF2493 domain-containing protein [Planomonospora sp. ID82291]MBG0818721.1 DUF2493 domain-containing protein [Planomonospora sp. ID82291]
MIGCWRVLLTGSRWWTDKQLLWRVLDAILAVHPDMVVVHGACYPSPGKRGQRPERSADWLAHLWCQERGVPEEPHPADWDTHGRAAGPIRNRHMVKLGADECVAFLHAGSRGSLGCALQAHNAGIPTRPFRPARPRTPRRVLART